jgi:hypothetical protein
MLRKLIFVALIVLNLGWWVWAKGWLAPVGLPAMSAGEPERLARQIDPDALQVQPLQPGSPSAEGMAGPDAEDADSAASDGDQAPTARRR